MEIASSSATSDIRIVCSNMRSTNIAHLPDDVLLTVLAKVASKFIKGLFSVKLSCKGFIPLCDNPIVCKAVTFRSEEVIAWNMMNEMQRRFYECCLNSDNVGLLLRDGMSKFFVSEEYDEGKKNLEKARDLGDKSCKFVLRVIDLYSDNDDTKKSATDWFLKKLSTRGGRLGIFYSQEGLENWLNDIYYNDWPRFRDINMIPSRRCNDPVHIEEIEYFELINDYDDYDKYEECPDCCLDKIVRKFHSRVGP